MIDVVIYTNQAKEYIGFRMTGHAGYADYGQDIVCSAVSVLVINTINSIEEFTQDTFENAIHQEEDVVSFEITSHPVSASAQLLLKSLVLGLTAIESEYGKKHVKVHFKRKQEV
ncbi:MAG: ribosomal-processing cysteine protease Prp [Lachnospiraceae bacterium]|nr:ribosomal-processing cysteine protease Prp [Lachnospiraceae bacterium]